MGSGNVSDGVGVRSGPGNRSNWLKVEADGSINVNLSGSVSPYALTPVETKKAVTDVESIAKAANANRRNLSIQNLGASPVQVYLTTGLGFANGGTLLQVGDVWQASQIAGTLQGIVYVICNTGLTATVAVTEET